MLKYDIVFQVLNTTFGDKFESIMRFQGDDEIHVVNQLLDCYRVSESKVTVIKSITAVLEDEPEEDDYTTEDHRTFYQYGKCVLQLDEDTDYKTALVEDMKKNNFFPSAFWISDHGNAHRIDMSGYI